MNCPMCGNQHLKAQENDLYCEFCHTVVPSPTLIEPEIEPAVEESPRDLQDLFDSIVRLRIEDRIGTGFIIDESGLVLTNYHVVEGDGYVFGSLEHDLKTYTLYKVLLGDEENDLALLRMNSYNTFQPLSFANEDVSLGEEVMTIGNPHGIGLSVSKGFISRIGSDGDLQINMQLNQGNSGGPILDQDGNVVGIVSYLIEEIQGMSFAIGMNRIRAFIQKYLEDNKDV